MGCRLSRIAAGLHYYGDVKTLHLSYSQIERVRVVGALRPRLQLTYRVTRSGPVEFLSIEVRDGSSATEQYATLQQIRAKIALLPNTHHSPPQTSLLQQEALPPQPIEQDLPAGHMVLIHAPP